MHKAILVAASLAGLLVCGTTAWAEPATTNAAPTTATDSTAPDLDKIVCRTEAPMVGTLLGARRHCATVREWNQRQADSQKALTDSQRTFTPGR